MWIHLFKSEEEELKWIEEYKRARRFQRRLDNLLNQFSDGQIKAGFSAMRRYQRNLLIRHKKDKKRIFGDRTMIREMLNYVFQDIRGYN